MKLRYSLFALLTLAGCSNTGDPASASTPAAPVSTIANGASTPALDGAHQAYLEGDYQALTERIRDVLLDTQSSDIVKANAYELLEKAYEVKGGNLPSTYVPPAGIHALKYGLVNAMNGGRPFHAVYLYGRIADASLLRSITVRLLPNETILDSNDPAFKLSTAPEQGAQRFVLEGIDTPTLPHDGVVSVRFTLKDGTTSESWFISHGQTSTATPELTSPLPAATLREGPVVSWLPFRSPENASFEHRTLSIWVSKDDGSNKAAWDYWRQDYGDLASVKVGGEALTPGDYWFNVTCGETRGFGPFLLARDSRAVQSFHLAP